MTATNATDLTAALDAGRTVRAIVHDASGQRHDGTIEGVYADSTFAFVDDDATISLTLDPRDVIEWEVVD